MYARSAVLIFVASLFQLFGCDSDTSQHDAYQPLVTEKPAPVIVKEYAFSAVPEGSQMRIPEVYGPLVDYLNAHINGAKLVLVAPKSHAELEAGLLDKKFAFALANAFQTVNALNYGYRVIAKKGDDDQFYGIIVVRRDGGINEVKDLKGKKVCYPSPSGVAATILPMYFLKSHGINVFKDIENLYVGSHESSIMHVYSGKAAAGTARVFSWEAFQKNHPQEASELELKWQSEPLIDQAILASGDVPKALSDHIAELLTQLHETADGQRILSAMSASRFDVANNATYDKARQFFKDNAELLPTPIQGQ